MKTHNQILNFLLIFFILITSGRAMAQEKALAVYLTDGTRVQYRLDDVDSLVYEKYIPEPTYHNNFEYIDLGLSVMWAKCNVGASSPEEAGYYIAWADTIGYTDYTKDEHQFSWGTYKYSNGSNETLTKYCPLPRYGYVTDEETATNFTDNLLQLTDDDDAALRYMGDGWHTPTYAEMVELKNNCYWEWTADYHSTGIPGYIVYKAKDEFDKGLFSWDESYQPVASYSVDDTHIFLPIAGYRRGVGGVTTSTSNKEGVWHLGKIGCYWTANVLNSEPYKSRYLDLKETSIIINASDRCFGSSVRAVYRPNTENSEE